MSLCLGIAVLVGAATAPGTVQGYAPSTQEQWHLAFLRMNEANSHSDGSGVVVGVVDSGVDSEQPDLAGSVLDGVDLTLQGDSSRGKQDLSGHGTGMAGLIAAHGQVLGIAPKAKITPIRDGIGRPVRLPEAVDWAIAHDVDVLCLAQGAEDSSPEAADAISRALKADIVVVAAAGNRPVASAVWYPAAYPGVVAVGGIDRTGSLAGFSVTGRELTLAAPAVSIRTTGLQGGYQTVSGTSPATAIVAGVAALVRSKYPDLSAQEVVHRMTATAIDKGPQGRDDQYGYGIVDPVAALTADVPPLAGPSPDGRGNPPDTGDVTGRIVLFGGIGLAVLVLLTGLVLARRRR